jgi:hypothetical protein
MPDAAAVPVAGAGRVARIVIEPSVPTGRRASPATARRTNLPLRLNTTGHAMGRAAPLTDPY